MEPFRINKRYVNQLNYEVLKNLNNSIKSTAFKKGKIVISASWADKLRQRYKINGRFKTVNDFLVDHSIITRRFYSKSNYSEIVNGSFQIRIANHRKVKYIDQNLDTKYLCLSSKFLCFKFVRKNVVNLK